MHTVHSTVTVPRYVEVLVQSTTHLVWKGMKGCSAAAPIEKREEQSNVQIDAGKSDFQIVSGVINGITQGIKRTHSDISKWRGDQQGANLVLDDSEYLYRDIIEGTRVVARTGYVSAWDTSSMLAPANNLNTALEGMIDALINRKRQVEKINYTPIVRSQLLKIRDSTDAMSKTLFSKLPTAASLPAPQPNGGYGAPLQQNGGWGQPAPQQNGGYGPPPQQNGGW
ncbi:hypothetical protein BLS_000698 [Venturia inaequalis]|uniref:Uncharacterized protein n=1 Tax=Venturia inaequalis TaxID=5025 RepID=A0A8H3U358_VENIN|nr:hypothetical protein BLS_000698 [Venturia inaequalis]